MSEYIISVDENDERWHYVEQQYTHFFGYPITDEIVRCRDCKLCDERYGRMLCRRDIGCDEIAIDVEPDGFCKWAERRDG